MRRIVSGALAVAAVTAAMTLSAVPAAAAGSCSSPNFCLFENEDFNRGNTNHWLDLTRDDFDLNNNYWYNGSGNQTNDSIDNETSSVKNRRGCNVMLWQHVGGTGASTKSISGTDDGKLANNNIGDNRLSAVDMCV